MNRITVYRDSKAFGAAKIIREGLYLRISIRCPESVRLCMQGEKGILDLGICVPMEEGFGIETRIPVKRVGEKILAIHTEESFHPISKEKPFLYLHQLRNCFYAVRDGKPGIQKSISNPTGQ